MKSLFQYLFHRDHFIIIAFGLLLLLVLKVITINIDFLNPIANALDEFSVTDMMFDIQHATTEPEVNDLVTIVDMTDLHDRGDIANLFEEINQCNPLVMGIDLIFEGEKDDHLGNELLLDAVHDIEKKAIFTSKLTDYSSAEGTFKGCVRSFFADELDIMEAYSNVNNDLTKEVVRDFGVKQKLNEEAMLSFPAKIASIFDDSVDEMDDDELLINFKNVVFPVVMFDEVLDKQELIEGHIVLVGTMTEEQDMHNSPLGKMPGVELQAYSLLTLLEHKAMKKNPVWLDWLLALLVCYLMELSIDALFQWVCKKDKAAIMVFLKESNVLDITVLFVWMVLVCWFVFIMFAKYNTIVGGGTILALLALTCEGRDIYKSIIKALVAKYGNKRFVCTSLLKDA